MRGAVCVSSWGACQAVRIRTRCTRYAWLWCLIADKVWHNVAIKRLPSFAVDDAQTFIVGCIKAQRPVPDGTPEDVDEDRLIRAQYAGTIDLLIEAVGCCPRTLLWCLGDGVPLTDAELRCRVMTREELAAAAKQEDLPPAIRAWMTKTECMSHEELAAAEVDVQMPSAWRRSGGVASTRGVLKLHR